MKTPSGLRLESGDLKKRKAKILSRSVKQIDLEKLKTVGELVGAFGDASIQARSVGTVAGVFGRMLQDPERPTIFLGLAGPLIAAGLRKVIRDLVEYGMVDAIVSTGAILYQDYYQACGFQHFRGDPHADDSELRTLLIDRIYDTYVDEEEFIKLDSKIAALADGMKPGEYSSRSFLEELSKGITDPDSILGTARRRGIPVFSPALNDSSIGIGLTEHYHRARLGHKKGVVIDAIRDNYELTQIVVQSKRTAAFYVAGGVPKNFINDAIVSAYVFGTNTGGHQYAVQLTTDAPHWGGLSGSTLSEATSWGKIAKEATHHMAFVEPSVSLPLVAGYALEKKLYERRSRIAYHWEGDVLKNMTYHMRNQSQKAKRPRTGRRARVLHAV